MFFLKIFILFFVYLALGFIFKGNHNFILPVFFIISISYNYILINNGNERKTVLFSNLPLILVFLGMILLGGDSFKKEILITYLISFLFILIISYAEVIKIIIFSLFYILLTIIFITPNLENYFQKKTLNVSKVFPENTLTNVYKEHVNPIKKVTVLNFWTTSCKACFDEIPKFEKLKLSYKNNNEIDFYYINVPLKKQNKKDNLFFFQEKNNRLTSFFAKDLSQMRDLFEVNSFPTILILKNDTIRYQGNLILGTNHIINNTKSIINNLLNE